VGSLYSVTTLLHLYNRQGVQALQKTAHQSRICGSLVWLDDAPRAIDFLLQDECLGRARLDALHGGDRNSIKCLSRKSV